MPNAPTWRGPSPACIGRRKVTVRPMRDLPQHQALRKQGCGPLIVVTATVLWATCEGVKGPINTTCLTA